MHGGLCSRHQRAGRIRLSSPISSRGIRVRSWYGGEHTASRSRAADRVHVHLRFPTLPLHHSWRYANIFHGRFLLCSDSLRSTLAQNAVRGGVHPIAYDLSTCLPFPVWNAKLPTRKRRNTFTTVGFIVVHRTIIRHCHSLWEPKRKDKLLRTILGCAEAKPNA